MKRYLTAGLLLLGLALTALLAAGSAQGGKMKPIPQFSLTPPSGAYGEVAVGRTVPRDFTLSVIPKGTYGPVTTSLSSPSWGFTITADRCNGKRISASKSCTITVSYSPTAVGASDAATLRANMGSEVVASVDLGGTGFANTQPTANGGSVSTPVNTATTINLQGSDSDGDFLTFAIASDPSHGTLTALTTGECSLGGGPSTCYGSVIYTPTAGYTGTDSFTITVSDGLVSSAAATIAIGVGVPAPGTRYIYWTNFNTNTIGRANLDGTGANQSFITGASYPEGVAADRSHVCWANFTGTIGRANLDGTGVNQSFITSGSNTTAVAVDSTYIYWANFESLSGATTIGRANLAGTSVNQSFATIPCPEFATSCRIYGLAVDSNYIYWADSDNYTIGRANLNGTTPNDAFITNNFSYVPYGVAVDSNYIYWTNETDFKIGRADLAGTSANWSFISTGYYPYGVAVDAGHIYWTNGTAGTIGRSSLDGTGANQDFITGGSAPMGVAVSTG
jgi:virginiamycin B lyase